MDLLEPVENVIESRLLKMWVRIGLGLFIILCVVTWLITRETIPQPIRIATAKEGGLYHTFAKKLATNLEKRTGHKVELVTSKGSVENAQLLTEKKVDLAIFQNGSFNEPDILALTPLYRDVMHVVVRNNRNIKSVTDLKGKKISVGQMGSGMRRSANALLQQYQFDASNTQFVEDYFMKCIEDPTIDAAIVTTGLLNPDLTKLLATKDFKLIDINDAKAISYRNAHFQPLSIPRGLYGEFPSIPDFDMPTISTTAFIGCLPTTSSLLVDEVLQAIFTDKIQMNVPILMSREETTNWHDRRWHPDARVWLNPYEGLGILANMMESLAAIKEILFAIGALFYLLWTRRKKREEMQQEERYKSVKERLDDMIDETARIEKNQIDENNPENLKQYLDEVTQIKLKALTELTHEDLRGDRHFQIFLLQCSNLMQKIQNKIIYNSNSKSGNS